MSNIKDFVSALSEKFSSENNVSDVTYCLFKSDDSFKKMFLKFHFPSIDLIKPVNEFKREFSFDDSRPDFMLIIDNKQYLIEVKLGDRNQHFKQYVETFPDAERSYITNYDLGEQKDKYKNDYIFHTWSEFIMYLDNQNEKNDLILGYIDYLKRVCSYLEVEYMNFESLNGLYYFNNLVHILMNKKIDDINIEYYSSKSNFGDSWSGAYFSLYKDNSKKIIYPWFGVKYSDEVSVCFDFTFDIGYCDILKSKLDIIQMINIDNSIIKPYDNGIEIQLSKLRLEEFQAEKDVNEQKKIMTSFFNDTVKKIANVI